MVDQKAQHRRISYLVYLAGVEVPATSVSVTQQVWGIPSATIVLPPDRLLQRIGREDRMRSTIFYLDTWRSEVDGDDPKWRLMFDGEVQSFSYLNSTAGRSVSLNCIDLAAALQSMKMFFLMNISNITQQVTNLTPEQASYGHHFRPTFPASLFFRGMSQTDGDEMKRPFDFVDNMFRSTFGDVDVDPFVMAAYQEQIADGKPADLKSVVGLNFFSRWSRKVNFHRRWIPMPVFENAFIYTGRGPFPVLRAVQSKQAIEAINSTAGRLGDNGSLWDLLRTIFQQMYYEVGAIASPSVVKVNRKSAEIVGPVDDSVRYQRERGARTTPLPPTNVAFHGPPQEQIDESSFETRMTGFVTKPQLLFAVPPACNVIWKSMVQRHQYSEDYANQPTRLVISEGNLFNTIAGGDVDQNLMEYINIVQAVGYPQGAQDGLDRRLGRNGNLPNAFLNAHNHLVWPEEFFKGPVYLNRPIPSWFQYLNWAQQEYAPDGVKSQYANVGSDVYKWVGKTGNVAKDQEKAKKALLKQITEDTKNGGATVGDGKRWAKRVLEARALGFPKDKASELMKVLTEAGQTDASVSTMRTYRLYARYEYFREKYSKRNGAVQMIFNPYIVPGYPMVVWDDDETQYSTFGYTFSVTHSLSANGAQTSVNYTFGRTFQEFFHDLLNQFVDTTEEVDDADPAATRALEGEEQRILTSTLYTSDIEGADQPDKTAQQRKEEARRSRMLELIRLAADAVPTNPIDEIRAQFQHNASAEEVYLKLFWKNDPTEFPDSQTRKAIFDVRHMVDAVDLDDAARVVPNTKKPVSSADPDDIVNFVTGFVPQADYEEYNTNPDAAMRFASRPVCTLDEWIDFQREYGIPEHAKKELLVAADDPLEGKGAPYYRKILDLTAGPGKAPTPTLLGNITTPVGADTRYDWQSILLRFREKVYLNLEPKIA